MPLQRQKHISQNVGIVARPLAGASAAFATRESGCHWVAAATPANVVAEIFRKRRREMYSMCSSSSS
jgi:hypothetical protein